MFVLHGIAKETFSYHILIVSAEGKKKATDQRRQARHAKRDFQAASLARRAENKKGSFITVRYLISLLTVKRFQMSYVPVVGC